MLYKNNDSQTKYTKTTFLTCFHILYNIWHIQRYVTNKERSAGTRPTVSLPLQNIFLLHHLLKIHQSTLMWYIYFVLFIMLCVSPFLDYFSCLHFCYIEINNVWLQISSLSEVELRWEGFFVLFMLVELFNITDFLFENFK